jgi:hypothetical protein
VILNTRFGLRTQGSTNPLGRQVKNILFFRQYSLPLLSYFLTNFEENSVKEVGRFLKMLRYIVLNFSFGLRPPYKLQNYNRNQIKKGGKH